MAPPPADAKLSFFEALYASREADAHEIAGGISLGAAAASKDKQAMRKRRITHVLIVHPKVAEEHPGKFTYGRLPLMDEPCANLLEQLPEALAFLCEVREKKGHVFVCCAKGISRSSSVVIAMMMFEQGIGFEEAFKTCEKKRPIVYPNIGFQQQLRHFEALLQELDQEAPIAQRVKRLKQLVPRGRLDGPSAPLQVREKMSESVTSVLDELEELADKVCRQPQLLQRRELWKRHGLYFENMHKYKALPSDSKLVDRAKKASETLKILPKIFSDSIKGVQLALAVAKELDSWARFAGPVFSNPLLAPGAAGAAGAGADAPAQGGSSSSSAPGALGAQRGQALVDDDEDPMKDFLKSKENSKKDKKSKKQAKADKKMEKAAKKARKMAEKIEKAAKKAELIAGNSVKEAEIAAERAEEARLELERFEAEEREKRRAKARRPSAAAAGEAAAKRKKGSSSSAASSDGGGGHAGAGAGAGDISDASI